MTKSAFCIYPLPNMAFKLRGSMPQVALIILLLGAIVGLGQTGAKHPFGPEDWAALRVAHAVALASDGNWVLYEVNHGADQGPEQSEWWMIHSDGTGRHRVDLPRDFSPWGFTLRGDSLYGSWRTGGKSQFAVFGLRGITEQSVPSITVSLPRGVGTATPSPDGSEFALTFDPRPPDPAGDVRSVEEPEQAAIYVVSADGSRGARWCDRLNHVSEVAWSPDDRSLAVLSSTPKIGFHTVTSFIDVCNREGSRRVAERPTAVGSIAWLDGGKDLAFLSTSTHVLTPDHVWTVPAAGGEPVDRTPALAGSSMQLRSDPQGRVWVSVQRGVRQEVDSFADGVLSPVYKWAAGNVALPIFAPYATRTTSLVFTVNDPKHAPNLATVKSGSLKKITDEGQDDLDATKLADVRPVSWTSKQGIALEGIATFPAGFDPTRHYPFMVFPHSGPEANDTLTFNPMAQVFAAEGYVVLQPEYRGSTGYGSAFMEAIYQHRGDRTFQDVDSATDFAVAQGWADPRHLCIFGWSAGGFVAAWTVTQTHRYRAAIDGAGVTDWSSFIWTSDTVQTDYDERWPDEDPEAFRRFSPVIYAKDITTPLLILHGTRDERIPMYQGLELFQIMAARGKVVRMVTYPGSPHFPVLWQQRLNVLREISNWLTQHNS